MSEATSRRRRWAAAMLVAGALVLSGLILQAPAQEAPDGTGDLEKPDLTTLAEFTAQSPGTTNAVSVRGALTGYSTSLRLAFIQDGDAAIAIEGLETFEGLESGQLVEVTGSGVRRWAGSRIAAKSLEILGTEELPDAKLLEADRLYDLENNARRVELRGVVTEIQEQVSRLFLRLRVGHRQIPVYLVRYNWMDERLPRLKDSIVRVRGVLSMRVQRRKMVSAAYLIASNPDDLTIEQIAPEDPFVIDESPIGDLLRMKEEEFPVRRVRIRGKYLRREPGQLGLLNDGENEIWAVFQGASELHCGRRNRCRGLGACEGWRHSA